jgi:regulator of protease activity HflC (stomatin/prohibitin superfamily)
MRGGAGRPPAPPIGGGLFIFGIVLAVFASLLTYAGVHKVDEGHMGVYWRGGALLNSVSEPGFHVMFPFITTAANVQVTLQTDTVRNIPCGTSGGVVIHFESIEVVNRLRKDHVHATIKTYGTNYDKVWIFDKIHHEINQFCSKHSLQEVYIDMFDTLDEALQLSLQQSCDKWDTGVDIVAIRVTKPKIPEAVMQNYLAVNEEKTRLLVAQQHQMLVAKEEETKRISALVAAQRESEVAKVNAEREAAVAIIAQQRETNVTTLRLEKEVKEKENEARKAAIETQIVTDRQRMHAESEVTVALVRAESDVKLKEAEVRRSALENRIATERIKALADAESYATEKMAAANKLRLTPEFLRFTLYQSLGNNTKIYFGPSIPDIFLQWADDNGSLTLKRN